MKREDHTSIAGSFAARTTLLLIASLLLTASGCALVGPTSTPAPGQRAPGSPEIPDATEDVVDGRSEVRNWSQLTKSGRENLLFDRHTAAEQDLLAAFEIAQNFRTSDARRRASRGNLEKLAADYRITDNPTAAARILQVIADATHGLTDFDSPGLSGLMIDLGDLYLMQGKLGPAAIAFDRALDLRLDKSGPNSATLIPIYQALSDVQIRLQQYARALDHATRSLELAQTHNGPASAEMVAAQLQAASANRYAGNLVEAEAQFRSALKAQRNIEASTLTEAFALNGIAFLYLELGRLSEALLNADLSLSILDEKGHDGIDRAMVLDTKAQILAAEGRTDSADELFDEVMLVATSASPEDQRVLYESYESFLRNQNRTSEALEIRRKIERIDAEPVPDDTAEPELDSFEASQNAAEAEPSLPDVSSPRTGAAWDES